MIIFPDTEEIRRTFCHAQQTVVHCCQHHGLPHIILFAFRQEQVKVKTHRHMLIVEPLVQPTVIRPTAVRPDAIRPTVGRRSAGQPVAVLGSAELVEYKLKKFRCRTYP